MKQKIYRGSVARIADLDRVGYEVERLPRDRWKGGDYVVGRVYGSHSDLYVLERTDGRMMQMMQGDLIIGALGHRAATLEGVGSWRAIEDDTMDALTSAGLLGKATSVSQLVPKLMQLRYKGHVMRNQEKVCMSDFVEPVNRARLDIPVIVLIGTSMSAGKTTTGRFVVHELKRLGYRVAGAKLTGAGRYRDILSFRDAGADSVLDFVDAGLPSTVVPKKTYAKALDYMFSRIARFNVDVLVAEAGASPLEPYNGAQAYDAIKNNVCFSILCASDPYAVVGVQKAFGLKPDLVTGPATSTDAAISLVKDLTGVDALNVLDPASTPILRDLLASALASKPIPAIA